jgi:3-oxoacyl-[acyl-carrier protein] reductase
VTPGEGRSSPSFGDGAGEVSGPPADDPHRREGDLDDRDRDVDPDLSSAARALAAFVVSERRPSPPGPDDAVAAAKDPGTPYEAGPYADTPAEGGHRPYAREFGPPAAGPSPAGPPPAGPPPGVRARTSPPRAVPPRGVTPAFFGLSAVSDEPAGGEERPGHPGPVPDGPGERHPRPLREAVEETPAAGVALVTGAGRGIGRAIAVGLGRAGVSVALLGRSPDALEEVAAEIASYGVGASWAGADVRDYVQVSHAVERLESALGEIDLLVNNAGVIEPVEVPVWEAGPETWWHVVETDLRGPFHCVRAVVPGMVGRGGGRVVNLSSGAGAGDRDVYSAYAAAKAGLFRITGSLHLAGFHRGMRAFEISPGVVRTEMTATMAIHTGRVEWTPVDAIVDLVVAVASGRLDAWSGGFLRAGVDTPESLSGAEGDGLPPTARRLRIMPYGPGDPLVPGTDRTSTA